MAVLESARFEHERDGTGDQQHREQEVGGDDRPAEVARDGEEAERRLRERPQEDYEREPGHVAGQPGRAASREPDGHP